MIQKQLHEPLKLLGMLKIYNGSNINQSKHFIKISCKSYLVKILESYNWMDPFNKTYNTPMIYIKEHFNKINEAKGPNILEIQVELARKMDLNFNRVLERSFSRQVHVVQKICTLSSNSHFNQLTCVIPYNKLSIPVPQRYKRGWILLLAARSKWWM